MLSLVGSKFLTDSLLKFLLQLFRTSKFVLEGGIVMVYNTQRRQQMVGHT